MLAHRPIVNVGQGIDLIEHLLPGKPPHADAVPIGDLLGNGAESGVELGKQAGVCAIG